MTWDHSKEESIMDGWTTTMRELTTEEMALVSGAFTWQGLGGAMLAGGLVGGLGAAVTGAGVPPAILAGMLLGGISYCITDLINQCV
jgi:hypothetical protein